MRLKRRVQLPALGLAGRVFAAVVAGIGVALLGFALVANQAIQGSVARALQEQLALAQVTAGRFDDFVDQTIRVTETLIEATNLPAARGDRAAELRFAQSLYEHLGAAAYYIAVIQPDFRASLVYPPEAEVLAHDFSDSNCVNHAFGEGLVQVTRSFTLGTPTPSVAMVVPILAEDGQVLGVALATLNLNAPDFVKLLQPGGLSETGYLAVIDRTGVILGATRPELRWQQDEHGAQFTALIQARATSIGTCRDCHTNPQTEAQQAEDLVAFAPLSVAPWGIALRQSREVVFLQTDALRTRLLVLSALVFLIAGISSWALTQLLVRPLRGLTAACQKLAEGDLDAPVPTRGPAELGALAEAFHTMRQRLKTSLAEITNWNNQLEQAVAERNAELIASRKQLLDANHDLSALNTVSATLTQSMDLPITLDDTLQKVIELTGMTWGCICLSDTGGGLNPAAVHQASTAASPLCQWPAIQEAVSKCLDERQAQVVEVMIPGAQAGAADQGQDIPMAHAVCIPLSAKGNDVGALTLVRERQEPCSAAEITLLSSIGSQIGMAIQNALLYQTLRGEEEMRRELLRKVITAQEEERRRIARELHDETSQALTALSVGLETTIMAPAANPEDVKRRLAPIKTLSTGMLQEIQRMIQDLRPSLLDDLGLTAAIDWYADLRLKAQGVQVLWERQGVERRLPNELETTIFRVAQETISNIAQHADAEKVRILLVFGKKEVMLEIEDDGNGFDAAEAFSRRQHPDAYGLLGMRERIMLLGGELLIESAKGHGTRVCAQIPIAAGNGRKA